jgi:thioredoxin reductase
VGSGPAGMAVATRLARAGRAVEVLDDQLIHGGGTAALGRADRAPFARLLADFAAAVGDGAVRLRTRTTAGGVYGRDLLVVGEEGASIVEARAVVLACGAEDGAVPFEGNDLPGVVSARAAGILLARSVLVGRHVALVVTEGGGPFGDAFARSAAELPPEHRPRLEQVSGVPVGVRGSNRPRSVTVQTAAGERELDCDAVVLDAPRAPAHELAQQAGAELVHEPRGYVVQTDRGRIAEGFFACGEITGTPFDAALIEADADRVAESVLAG